MKKRLLIVVGAGASIEFGLPSVKDIDDLLLKAAFTKWTLASNRNQNLYGTIRDSINAYRSSGQERRLAQETNFEEVLYQLYMLEHHISDRYHLTASNALLTASPLPYILDDEKPQQVVSGMLSGLANHLANTIIDECIARCEVATTEKKTEIATLRHFLSELSQEFEIGVVTLNYDNIISQADPSLFTGFNDCGVFEPEAVFDRQEWNFIYHLHGSIHFSTEHSEEGRLVISRQQTPLTSEHGRTSGGHRRESMEGLEQLNSVIVAGYGKMHQILRQPFRTYFAQTQRLIHIADSVLFLGYGFRDVHLNEVFSDVQGRKRPRVVVDWAHDQAYGFERRRDDWTHNVSETLFPYGRHPSFTPDATPQRRIGDYKSRSELEICLDPDLPFAIWYGGLLSACREPEKIVAQLKQRG